MLFIVHIVELSKREDCTTLKEMISCNASHQMTKPRFTLRGTSFQQKQLKKLLILRKRN